jgi:hypothetical protein
MLLLLFVPFVHMLTPEGLTPMSFGKSSSHEQ